MPHTSDEDQTEMDSRIERYRLFWDRESVDRPLIGFDVGGFYPLQRFQALQQLGSGAELQPDMVDPSSFLDAYEQLYREGLAVGDRIIRGASPIPALPWMEAMLGCPVRIAKDSIWAEERAAGWEELEAAAVSDDNPWLRVYLDFLRALVRLSAGRYPVSQPILRGVSDLMGALRGHSQVLIDCIEFPERARPLARACADALIHVITRHLEAAEPFHGGYSIEQYSLWCPDRIVRLQEDASSVYSPTLYREIIKPEDRRVAAAFPLCLIHLHSSSLFLLDDFLDIDDIDVFQINRDAVGVHLQEMVPGLKKIQDAGRLLLLRADFQEEEIALVARELSPIGLMIQIVTHGPAEAVAFQDLLRRYWTDPV